MSTSVAPVDKLETGIPGFDFIAEGGLPQGRTCLVAGTSGSAKTVFAVQFLAEGIERFETPGVFVTFEETPDDIRRNMVGFGWDIATWEAQGLWRFVDVSPDLTDNPVVVGDYDLDALISRVTHAVSETGATRVSLDSVGAIFGQFEDSAVVRRELFRVAAALRQANSTAVITAERSDEYGSIARYGIEEFVADNVVVLRNVLEETRRRRTMEILKFRGAPHSKGEFPFSVLPQQGIVAIPLSAMELQQTSSNERSTSGNAVLDEMTSGGFFKDSIMLVSGATGTGKTLLTSEFLSGATEEDGGRALLFAFEEGYRQFMRNAAGWGINLKQMEDEGQLKVVCQYPEVAGLEDHLIRMKESIKEFRPTRVAVDSLSALERVSSMKGFREFVVSLTSFIKDLGIMGLFTATTPTLLGGTSATEAHISTITDAIVLLRYVELHGEMNRSITVLKMRGSSHDKRIRKFTVDDHGLHIGKPFHQIAGVLSGNIHILDSAWHEDGANQHTHNDA